MATKFLARGAHGPDVVRWQNFLKGQGFDVGPIDGDFGRKTEDGTKGFQKAHKLDVDGVVGPQTTAAAVALGFDPGSPAPAPTNPTGNNHVVQRAIYKAEWKAATGMEPNLADLQIAQATDMLETAYGNGWKGAGKGSNNRGAIQCSGKQVMDHIHAPAGVPCPSGCFPYDDTQPQPDGTSKVYGACFKIYPTPNDGVRALIKEITERRPKSWQAMDAGDIDGYSGAMYDEHYYQGFGATRAERVDHHAHAVEQRVQEIALANGEPVAAKRGGPPAGEPPVDGGSPTPAPSGGGPTFGETCVMALLTFGGLWALTRGAR